MTNITYSLKITDMQVAPQAAGQENVVVKAHWAYTGTTDDNRTAGFGGSTDLVYTEGGPFTPYSELTEEQVQTWVLNSWSEDYTNNIKNIMEAQLALKSDPLPWAQSSDTESPVTE